MPCLLVRDEGEAQDRYHGPDGKGGFLRFMPQREDGVLREGELQSVPHEGGEVNVRGKGRTDRHPGRYPESSGIPRRQMGDAHRSSALHGVQVVHGGLRGRTEKPAGRRLPAGLRGGIGLVSRRQETVHAKTLSAVRQPSLRGRVPQQGGWEGDLEEHEGEKRRHRHDQLRAVRRLRALRDRLPVQGTDPGRGQPPHRGHSQSGGVREVPHLGVRPEMAPREVSYPLRECPKVPFLLSPAEERHGPDVREHLHLPGELLRGSRRYKEPDPQDDQGEQGHGAGRGVVEGAGEAQGRGPEGPEPVGHRREDRLPGDHPPVCRGNENQNQGLLQPSALAVQRWGRKKKKGRAGALKMDGSPYNPFVSVPHAPYGTSPSELNKVDMAICPKGQAGLQSVYDPYRITKVIKRAGKGGEGKWMAAPFDRAVDEIVGGGKLFRHVPGEENREVTGLKEIYALRDPKIAKEMGEDAKAIGKAKDKKKAVEEFKAKHAPNLSHLIDPDHPDLGPKNNQMVYMWGRKKGGRGDFSARFFGDYFGTVNTHGHTTVCQGSLYFTCKAMSEQYEYSKFGGGKKFYWQGDFENSEYILCVGSNLFDANYGPSNRNVRLIPNLVSGKTKMTVVDPRFNKAAAQANPYLPIQPGEDGAFFAGIIQWIINNKKVDAKYLACANKAAAKAAGEPTWSNALLLVKMDKDGKPGKFLLAHEIGLAQPEKRKDKDDKEHDFEYLVAMKDGKPVAVDPNDDKNPVTGDLLVDAAIGDVKVKSGLKLVAEAANAKPMDEWSRICGIPAKEIDAVAKELTRHGKKTIVDVHRGIAQHTNGFYNVLSAMTINLLLGNFDWKGGMIEASTYNTTGGKEGQPFALAKMAPGKNGKFGISVIRHDVKYEETSLFSGYPAKRNWWPLASDIYEEIVPSIGDAYPYPIKALFSYMCTPVYALPAGQTNIPILMDVGKVPLYFCSDILIGD